MKNIKIKKSGEIKADECTPMQREILNMLQEDNRDDTEQTIKDLQQYGCQSGIIGDMIYTRDTTAFYQKHAAEISQLLNDIDTRPDQLNGWDNTDPLAMEDSNKNLLAWAAVEIIAAQVLPC
jgi:phosphoribosylformimino-5-aminoimidazole carboxamide ribonucleotide (ProFAR) isomerase